MDTVKSPSESLDDDFFGDMDNAAVDADGTDYDSVDDDSVDSDDVAVHRHQNYTILSEEDISQRQEDDILSISTALSLSRFSAGILLCHYKWSVSQVQNEWFADEGGVRRDVGLFEEPIVAFSSATELICGICLESQDEMNAASCGHLFCTGCWAGYIRNAINGGLKCLMLRCPDESCSAAVGQDFINILASDEDKEKYSRYFLRSYIEDNKKIKWCPAPGCDYAVEFAGDSVCYDVFCRCSYSFCWKCNNEAHRPVDCDTVTKWLLANLEDDENLKWMVDNSKPCPKCKRHIEKNNGCLHMTCLPPCGFEFCWHCLGKWSDHDLTVGGFYNCEGSESSKHMEMIRNDHAVFYKQWVSNQSASLSARENLQRLQTLHLEKLSIEQCLTESQVKFIIEAWQQIAEGRQVLKWTYVYKYFLPVHERDMREFLEYFLGEARSCLERLHQYAEKIEKYLFQKGPSEDFNEFRTKLAGLTRLTQKHMEDLVQAAVHGK